MPEAGIHRHFLGWQRPLVQLTAAHLAQLAPTGDLSDTLLVVSGGQAGRRILGLLADGALAAGTALLPPRIVTPGLLPERLYVPTRPPAGAPARQMAWVAALGEVDPELVRRIFPRLGTGADNLTSLQAAARQLDRCAVELASGGLDFAQLANRAQSGEPLGDAERWTAAAALQDAFVAALASAGLADGQQERNRAIERGAIGAGVAMPARIVLAGVVELTPQPRAMLRAAADTGTRILALIHAPQELSGRFDEWGCANSALWMEQPIDLSGANIRIVGGMSEQAEEAFAAIARAGAASGRPVRTDQVTIGLCDQSLLPYLQTTARNLPDVPVRYGAGRAVGEMRPYQLLSLAARFLGSRRFVDYAALVRHLDVELYARRPVAGEAPPRVRDWRALLDDYAGQYLPDRLDESRRDADGWPGEPPNDPDQPDDRADLAWLYRRAMALLGELATEPPDRRQPPARWAQAILALLRRAYAEAGDWDQRQEGQRQVVMACGALRDVLEEVHALRGTIEATASETIGLALALAGGTRIAPPADGNDIEIVGWLELPGDDAEYLVITGFNEGCVPEPAAPEAFLTDGMRRRLGLSCDFERCARDAYLLTAAIACRAPGAVTLIAGRRSGEGDPLFPSRLLFRGAASTVARRIVDLIDAPAPRPLLAYRFAPGAAGGFDTQVKPVAPVAPIASMRVTSFRDYISSPAGFYLRHVLNLETIEDSAPRELDAMQCGSLVHEVMRSFAASPARDSISHQQCQDAMIRLLDERLAARFGQSDPPGAMRFQAEMIRRRLLVLGEWQAGWAKDGWRIRFSEWRPGANPSLAVDGMPMYLRGRIDRIDRHESGAWAILDYKLGGGKIDPGTHRAGDGTWKDLQLPLYRHLAAEVVAAAQPQLGYIAVGDRDSAIGGRLATWTADDLLDADEAARRVIRKVRNGEFSDPGDHPPTDGMFAHIFGATLLNIDADEEADDDADQATEGGAS